ncbi:MAG: CBS domain-containing protein [Spirochaetota bacterium]
MIIKKPMNERQRLKKTQELVYELKVKDVMTKNVITISPDAMMSDLRSILRDNKISGTPVAKDNKLVGIISIEDFINWLADDKKNCTVACKMITNVRTLGEDEPLVHAVSRFEEYGFGRFPVINRSTGELVGVLTKGDVIEGLLREIEIDWHEEEIRRYRASHFFEDFIADKMILLFKYYIKEKKIETGGEVASELKTSLKRLGVHPDIVRRTAIATYEAEMNVIIYADEGEINVTVTKDSILIEVNDRGPGIPDIQKALEPGYSTSPDWVRELGFGAGMGLNNIQNCAQTFDIQSTVGQGTSLKIYIPMEKL